MLGNVCVQWIFSSFTGTSLLRLLDAEMEQLGLTRRRRRRSAVPGAGSAAAGGTAAAAGRSGAASATAAVTQRRTTLELNQYNRHPAVSLFPQS